MQKIWDVTGSIRGGGIVETQGEIRQDVWRTAQGEDQVSGAGNGCKIGKTHLGESGWQYGRGCREGVGDFLNNGTENRERKGG